VYGPRQISHGEAGVVSIFIEKYLKKERPYLYTYPEEPDGMIRDYVFVKDVVKANVLALDKGTNDFMNIGTGKETTTGELLREIAKQMQQDYNPIKDGPRPGDIRKSCLVIKKANEVLNWQPDYSLSEGVAETIDYFKLN
jgi:UDP-glucose 4-epimerase